MDPEKTSDSLPEDLSKQTQSTTPDASVSQSDEASPQTAKTTEKAVSSENSMDDCTDMTSCPKSNNQSLNLIGDNIHKSPAAPEVCHEKDAEPDSIISVVQTFDKDNLSEAAVPDEKNITMTDIKQSEKNDNNAHISPDTSPESVPHTDISSPESDSASRLDSGVSQDDSSSEICSKPESQSRPHLEKQDSSFNNTSSCSETPVTVSDLDTPCKEESDVPKSENAVLLAAASNSDQESVYYIKWVLFDNVKIPIITQNENGPCPLLAIINVLLLKEKVKLAPMLEMITSEQLMTYLGECIFENMPQDLSETSQANYEQNMQDAMAVMYKLQTGLDVNVKFTGVKDFEYTSESIIFDLLEISLYHGWLVDPQDADTVQVVHQCSYNQLVEKIITMKQSDKEEDVTQALIGEQFLDRSASQLTYHGLCELSSCVKEKELCVFFRNNHFNTLLKHNDELFLLVTDQGFLTERNVVWETLSNVDGDCHFVDASFRTYTKPTASSAPIPDTSVPVGSPEQIDHDYQVALFLQDEATAQPTPSNWGTQDPSAMAQADLEFAMQLQEEENRMALEEQQREEMRGGQGLPGAAPNSQNRSPPRPSETQRRSGDRDRSEKKEKDRDCCIL